ncbi:MAG: BNR repeat-containing protein [Saprospiraceae bacterium]
MQYFKLFLFSTCLLFLLQTPLQLFGQKQFNNEILDQQRSTIIEELLIDSVWAANKVSFALRTVGDQQFVAYYDKNRMMTVAVRNINSKSWEKKTLPNQLKWDSHNYVALGIDEMGYLHVSGNMHVNPLVYFRSTRPYDIQSLVEVNKMVSKDEADVTYPRFFYDKNEKLHFSYRSGTCGNGNILVNQFNPKTKAWIRYLDEPLFAGIEADDDRAAYHRFVKDSKGDFHYIWMWRWTPEVATSHQICYATTPDLQNWKNAAGKVVQLPLTPDDEQLIVDPTPSKGGMHNGKYQIILDKNDKPFISYLKYDEQGLTQLYLAHFEQGAWQIKKISDWNFRWEFVGGGDKMSEGASFNLNGFTDEGWLTISWSNDDNQSGIYIIDPKTLTLIDKNIAIKPKYPPTIHSRLTDHPKMSVNLRDGNTQTEEDSVNYVLKWESMGKSHGRHAPEVIPEGPISPLKIIKFK